MGVVEWWETLLCAHPETPTQKYHIHSNPGQIDNRKHILNFLQKTGDTDFY